MNKSCKVLIFSMLAIIILSLSGCSEDGKTDDELREEIISEIKEELEADSETISEDKEEKSEEKSDKVSIDIKDGEQLYEFINRSYDGKYSKEGFELWDPTYLDVTSNGTDEVIYTAPYGEGNLDRVIFIGIVDGEYQEIPSDIALMKYGNKIETIDGFIVVTQVGGGSSIRIANKSIYIFNGKDIEHTGVTLAMEDIVSTPDGYEIIGEIDGDLNEFTYTATKTSLATGESKVLEKTKYKYDKNYRGYDIEFIEDAYEEESIKLSTGMSVDEIITTLGDNYEISTMQDYMDGTTINVLTYPGIEFHLKEYVNSHEEVEEVVVNIKVSSNRYRYNWDIDIGDNALEAIKKCEEKFDHMINPHGYEGEEIVDWFIYREDAQVEDIAQGYALALQFNTGERYLDKSEIPEDAVLESIVLLREYD